MVVSDTRQQRKIERQERARLILHKFKPEIYKHMSDEEHADGVDQMISDLWQLALNDGCIAAGWALELLRELACELDDAKEEIQALYDKAAGASL